MASTNREQLEYDKFTTDLSGNIAVHTVANIAACGFGIFLVDN